MKPRGYFALALAAGSIGAGAWLLGRARLTAPPAAVTPKVPGTRLFETVLTHVRSFSVDSLSDQELYRIAAGGVLEELDDPYAVLLAPGQRRVDQGEEPIPLGLHLDRLDDLIVVVATVAGSPADLAGVRSGDRLVAVDSTVFDASRLDQALRLLEGTAGSHVTLRLRRDGVRATLPVEIVRSIVPVPAALESSLLTGGVMWVRVRRFVPGLADSVRGSVVGLRARGGRAMVLDLRDLVGGTLGEGTAVADLFLESGLTLATRRGREPAASERVADSTPSPFDSLPMVVLVDRGTAGAGELVAGALQDNDRAAVLGAVTFGRGVTQSTFALGGGTSLRLTTSLWLTPSGRQIQRPPRPTDGDSVPRPRLTTAGGRRILGGGGIVPDRLVLDSGSTDVVLAEAQRLLAKARSTRAVLALVAER